MSNLEIEMIVKFIAVATIVVFLWGMNYQVCRLNREMKELKNELDNLKAFLNV